MASACQVVRLSSSEKVQIPLLAHLIPAGIRPGTIFIVEFDPESQWFAIATTLVAGALLNNRNAWYLASDRPPKDVKSGLSALGVDVSAAQKSGRLGLLDQ